MKPVVHELGLFKILHQKYFCDAMVMAVGNLSRSWDQTLIVKMLELLFCSTHRIRREILEKNLNVSLSMPI